MNEESINEESTNAYQYYENELLEGKITIEHYLTLIGLDD